MKKSVWHTKILRVTFRRENRGKNKLFGVLDFRLSFDFPFDPWHQQLHGTLKMKNNTIGLNIQIKSSQIM